jgi:hypothetical protein
MYLLTDLHSYFVRSCQKETRMNVRQMSQITGGLVREIFYVGFNDRGGSLCVKGQSFHLFP